jgi:16S rRNA (cytosine967-C5)-methyltransferase
VKNEKARRLRSSARAVVVDFLEQAETKGLRLDRLSSTGAFRALDLRDRSFANELAYGILRNRGRLDFFIQGLSDRPVNRLDPVVVWILRLGLYELAFLRTAHRAAVHEAAELSRVFGKASASGFVNALLRRFLREQPTAPEGSSAHAMAIRYSHPEWLVRRYLARYGAGPAEALLRRNNTLPLPVVRVNRFKTDPETFRGLLQADGIAYEPFAGAPDSLIVRAPAFSVHRLYAEGYCYFMDPASQEVADRCDLGRASVIGDFCAAPGGKAFILAWRKAEGAVVHCADISRSRLSEVKRRAKLYGARGMTFAAADLTQSSPFRPVFDFALVDAPCTGLGTIRSNPDIRWKIQETQLARFRDRQLAILRNSFAALRPGARVVYATCSTEPEENEEVVEEFLTAEPLSCLDRPYYQTFPAEHPGDCFFSAVVRHR